MSTGPFNGSSPSRLVAPITCPGFQSATGEPSATDVGQWVASGVGRCSWAFFSEFAPNDEWPRVQHASFVPKSRNEGTETLVQFAAMIAERKSKVLAVACPAAKT